VIPSDLAGLEEMQPLEDFLAVALASSEEVLSVIRGAREDVELVASLLSDEKVVVDALVKLLPGLSPLLARVTVDPSVLPVEMGEAEEVRLAPGGRLIVCRTDGAIKTTDLTGGSSRDLLVEVMRDVVPKLKVVLDSMPSFLEPTIEQPETDALEAEEPVIQEPTVEHVVPEVPPEVAEVFDEEQQIEEAEEPLGVEEPTAGEEPFLEEPAEPEAFAESIEVEPVTLMEPAQDKEPAVSLPVVADELPEMTPVRTGDAQLRVYRRRVRRNEEVVRRQMAAVRRRRDAEIRRLREGLEAQEAPEWEEPKGFFGLLKRLFTRKR
jgi:hypothetical protein